MNDLSELSGAIKKDNQSFTRRGFLKLTSIIGLGAALEACAPKNVLPPVPFPTRHEATPTLPAPTGAAEGQSGVPSPDALQTEVWEARVDFQLMTQQLNFEVDPNGNKKLVSCDGPKGADNGPGYVPITKEFDWTKLHLPEVKINGIAYPVLTSRRNIDSTTTQFLEEWYQDPKFVDNLLQKQGLTSDRVKPIETLVVHYRSVRNDFWQPAQTGQGCERVFDDAPSHDPQSLYDELTHTLTEYTEGAVEYRQRGWEEIREQDLPLTTNPDLTIPRLIEWYKRAMNYRELGRLAVKNGASSVFVYAGSDAGMNESAWWIDPESGKKIEIFGFNYERDASYSLHSWEHFLENTIMASKMTGIYLKCVGRNEEYDILPSLDLTPELKVKIRSEMYTGRTYAAVGLGSVHLTPNSVYEYDYDSPIPVMLPGHDTPINMSLWNGNQPDYLKWWLKSLPRAFLSSVH